MGMYDNLRCEYPLGEGAPGGPYQTKSLDQMLDTYTITRDGQLVSGLGDPVSFTGAIRFYTYEGSDPQRWWEWHALFVRGRLQNLVLAESPEVEADPDER